MKRSVRKSDRSNILKMNILTVENAIIERIEDKVPGPKVEGYPDDPSTYRLTHPKGAILVHYQGASYGEPASFVVSQKQNARFDITIATKNLRTHTGAYAYLEEIKSALTGYMIPGLARLYPVQDGYLSYENGVWQYGMTFALNTVHEEPE